MPFPLLAAAVSRVGTSALARIGARFGAGRAAVAARAAAFPAPGAAARLLSPAGMAGRIRAIAGSRVGRGAGGIGGAIAVGTASSALATRFFGPGPGMAGELGELRKRRRMNPLNPKALRRAVRRLAGFHVFATVTSRSLARLAPRRRAARRSPFARKRR